MGLDISKVKKVILTWTYKTLNSEFPQYFNTDNYINTSGILVKNSPNVYWADTIRDRPLDATECYLVVNSDTSASFGVDGECFFDEVKQKYYYKMKIHPL